MQRPRNHQGRPQNQGSDRGGGRGRGRGRGAGGRAQQYPATVPNISQVVAGAHVSIILKKDQSSGQEVQGTVAEVLTSGNHPRGIKIKLCDGRVGRVQRMVTADQANAGSEGMSNLGRNGEAFGAVAQGVTTTFDPQPNFGLRNRDIRSQDGMEAPPSVYSLEDFLPPGHALNQRHVHEQSESASRTTPTVTCPVCEDFEGDEAAVEHHVNSHFDQ